MTANNEILKFILSRAKRISGIERDELLNVNAVFAGVLGLACMDEATVMANFTDPSQRADIGAVKKFFADRNVNPQAAMQFMSANLNNRFVDSTCIMGTQLVMNAIESYATSATASYLLEIIFNAPSSVITQCMESASGGLHAAQATESPQPQQSVPRTPASNGTVQGDFAPIVASSGAGGKKGYLAELVSKIKKIQYGASDIVFGQEHAIHTFTEGLFQAEAVADADKKRVRPRAMFLFAGPPGVGKTMLAETIAGMLGIPFKRFDMSEYSYRDSTSNVNGIDPQWKGARAGFITEFVSQNPHSVLLFDEIEKAHQTVLNLFLQILDAGKINDVFMQKEIVFRDTIIVFTTNAGKQLYEAADTTNLSGLSRKTILDALSKDVDPVTHEPFFPAALCSRLSSGNVVMFNFLEAHNLVKIIASEQAASAKLFASEYGLDIAIDPRVAAAILFAEGGKADARAMKGRAGIFLKNELLELFRQLDVESKPESLTNLKKISITLNINDDDAAVRALFFNPVKTNVLVFSDGEYVKGMTKETNDYILHFVSDIDEALSTIISEDCLLVLADLSTAMSESSFHGVNLDDLTSIGASFFRKVRAEYPEIPVYLLETDRLDIGKESLMSYQRSGARGAITCKKGKPRKFTEALVGCCTDIYLQQTARRLAAASKVLSFGTVQSFSSDGSEAEICMYGFELKTAVMAEDTQTLVTAAERPDVRFDDVIGAEDVKSEFALFLDYIKNPKQYISKGIRPPKGILLYGPPGTGKTMLAKALAGESSAAFISADASSFLRKWAGEGEEAIRKLFITAKRYAPAVIFIDEVDAIAKERTGEDSGGRESKLNTLLVEIDGFKYDPKRPVFVVAATNFDIEKGHSSRVLDAAFVRRFDRRIYVDLPNKAERLRFINGKLASLNITNISDAEKDNIASRSVGESCSTLSQILERLARESAATGQVPTDRLLDNIYEAHFSGEEHESTQNQRKRTAYHESGHALLEWRSGSLPSYITIVSRGDYGGYMRHQDSEGKTEYTKEYLLGRITTCLAGRAAEIVYFGESDGVSAGASSDLDHATSIARSMICEYGMDDEIGLATLTREQITSGPLAIAVQNKVNEILRSRLDCAMSFIRDNSEIMDKLVGGLLADGYMHEGRIKDIFEPETVVV